MTDLSRRQNNRITFILCIKTDDSLNLSLLKSQIASCLAVSHAILIIGLDQSNHRLESCIASMEHDSRVIVSILNDSSLYDGWNKAVSISQTEFISFLGFGDCIINPRYYENVDLSDVDANFSRALVYSGCTNRILGRPFNRHLHYWRQMVAMIGAIFRHDLVATNGFDASLRIVGDYDFLLRVGSTMKAGFSPLTVVSMPSGGLSEGNYGKLMDEVRIVRKKRRRE